MKFLLYEIIPWAGFNLAKSQFWPAGRMFDTPILKHDQNWFMQQLFLLKVCSFNTMQYEVVLFRHHKCQAV